MMMEQETDKRSIGDIYCPLGWHSNHPLAFVELGPKGAIELYVSSGTYILVNLVFYVDCKKNSVSKFFTLFSIFYTHTFLTQLVVLSKHHVNTLFPTLSLFSVIVAFLLFF